MANKAYGSKTTLTGGGATALDSLDGASIFDGDIAFVPVNGVLYVYRLNATSGAAESSPDIISPDANAGDKRWILQPPYKQIVSGTKQDTTSGTAIDFTGIPSWVKKITVMFYGVSTNGSSEPIVQLLVAAGAVASGYLSGVAFYDSGPNSSTGFIFGRSGSADTLCGIMTIAKMDGNRWVESVGVGISNQGCGGGGRVNAGDVVTGIRITTENGTDAFDAGSVNILYE